MSAENRSAFFEGYVPDRRLDRVCDDALELTESGMEALCPSYTELAGIDDRYRDEMRVGLGALKEVFRIFDTRTRRWVAMARLRADRGPDFYDLFVREAWLVASLKHPNIIKVHDVGVDAEGRPYFTMDLKSNTTLADLNEGSGRSALNLKLQAFIKICDAVAYAHSRGVVHLDLKPENIQTDSFGEVLVCDWGLAKPVEEPECAEDENSCPVRSLQSMTLMGQVKGSLGYMAPEQVTPGAVKDVQTDIYALGCVLHFILTGRPPFTGTKDEILDATKRSGVGSPRLNYPDRYVPESLDAVVMKAAALDPKDRYISVERLQLEIEKYLAGFSTRAERPGFFREAKLFIARNRLPVAITVAALLGFGVMGSLFAQHIARQQRAVEAERIRAEQLSSEVETLDSEYSSYVEQTLEAKEALARELAEAAKQLKNLTIYERPVETVRQARQMARAALQQDPDCAEAHAQHFSLDCLELNYRAALLRPQLIETEHQYRSYSRLAAAFQDFSYSRTTRPAIPQFAEFFVQARQIDPRQSAHLERVLAYDFAARKNRDGYASVVEAFLQYIHGGPEHLALSFDSKNETVVLQSDLPVNLSGQYGECLLRFLQFRYLELDLSQQFQLADLDGLAIESLDLSRCRNVRLDKPVSLPHLKKIYVRSGQFPEGKLRRMIRTNEPFEMVEEPH